MTLVMGVLNVTPDSFSDGGEYFDQDAAIDRAHDLVALGADIIDVGGESTRPGSTRVEPEVEQQRILPVISALAQTKAVVSVDTLHAETARAAISAGADMINDVSGGTFDTEMFSAVAGARTRSGNLVRVVLGHWRGIPDPQHARSNYHDVAAEVCQDLARNIAVAHAAGVRDEQIILDPGLGFDKTSEQGWQLLARIDEIQALGYPVMIGVSRKRMLGELLSATASATATRDLTARDLPTAVTSALMADRNIWAVRVHDVAATRVALQVQNALHQAQREASS